MCFINYYTWFPMTQADKIQNLHNSLMITIFHTKLKILCKQQYELCVQTNVNFMYHLSLFLDIFLRVGKWRLIWIRSKTSLSGQFLPPGSSYNVSCNLPTSINDSSRITAFPLSKLTSLKILRFISYRNDSSPYSFLFNQTIHCGGWCLGLRGENCFITALWHWR